MRAPPPRAAGIGGAESLSEEGWEEGGWSVVIATGSPVALAARREWRGRDRQGPADPWGGAGPTVPGLHTTVTCHRHGHVCSTPRCKCQAGIRSPHMADTRRRDPHRQAHHIQRWTAIGRRGHVHVTHKDAGTTGCTGNAQAGQPPTQMPRPRRSNASQRPTHATEYTDTYATDKDPRRHHGDMLEHTVTNRQSTDKWATKNSHKHSIAHTDIHKYITHTQASRSQRHVDTQHTNTDACIADTYIHRHNMHKTQAYNRSVSLTRTPISLT